MGSKMFMAVLAIFVTIIISLSGYFVGVNADQDDVIDKKVNIKEFKELKEEQEKAHDKIDIKFERVIEKLSETNVRLEGIATKLEERTH